MTMKIMNCSVAKSLYKLIDVLELQDAIFHDEIKITLC